MKRPTKVPMALALVCGLLCAGLPVPTLGQEATDEAPATQLRVALDRVLAEHAFLIIEVMRTGLTPGPRFDAAGNALDANTNELVAAIQSVYGADAAAAFGEQWRNHIAFLVDYARALKNRDTSAANLADTQLQNYVAKFSALLAGAVQLPEAAVAGLIREHVDQLKQVASLQTADFSAVYPAILETYEHMFMIGDALATAITAQFPSRFIGQDFAFSAATDLRMELERFLAAHAELASLAIRADLTNAPDSAAAKAAIGQNSSALATAISSIYGQTTGDAVSAEWQRMVGLQLDYIEATKAGNTFSQATAKDALAHSGIAFAGVLARANPKLSQTELQDMIGKQSTSLITEADRFFANDYASAYAAQRSAYAASGVLGAYMARGIASQFPGRFPDSAYRAPGPNLQLYGWILLGLAALLVAIRRRPTMDGARKGG
jgi:hypothetical protein